MYQRSRQMLIFLVVTFLAIQIICGVLGIIEGIGYISGGKLWLYSQHWAHQAYDMNIRGVCHLRRSCVQLRCGRWSISCHDYLDIWHCLGDPCTVSCSLDCCKTLPWIARIISKLDCRRLFHGISEDSCVLLRKVRSWFQCDYLRFPANAPH